MQTYKVNMRLELPKKITAEDYHEFVVFEEMLQQLDKRFRIVEIEFDDNTGLHVGEVRI